MTPEIGAGILFGVLALFLLMIGVKRGFFLFSPLSWNVPILFRHLIGAFAVYFIVELFLSGVAVSFFRSDLVNNYIVYASGLNFGLALLIALSLFAYWRTLPPLVRNGILFRPGQTHSARNDLSQALYAWILAFPLVLSLSQILEEVVRKVFNQVQLPDQMAVRFLKAAFEQPASFFFAVVSIIILAPLVEESLFRGFLQTFIRRHLGPKYAIIVTSACFALFHYSAGQGYGNISIILSLFTFALFLGFLYEKQGSLLAPMFLHSAFNSISVINLYLFGGFTTSL